MSERGQTVLDFAIGVSVFLIVVAFVLAFVPGVPLRSKLVVLCGAAAVSIGWLVYSTI